MSDDVSNLRQYGPGEMSDPIHLGSPFSWTQANMGLTRCQTQYIWVQQSAEPQKT